MLGLRVFFPAVGQRQGQINVQDVPVGGHAYFVNKRATLHQAVLAGGVRIGGRLLGVQKQGECVTCGNVAETNLVSGVTQGCADGMAQAGLAVVFLTFAMLRFRKTQS